MNKELAAILRDKLSDISFIDLKGGLVYTQTKSERVYASDEDEEGRYIEKRFPVSCDYVGSECGNPKLIDFIPNNKRKGIFYFEENGIDFMGTFGNLVRYRSSLRLVVWLNSNFVNLASCRSLSTPVMTGIIERLAGKNPFNAGNLSSIDVTVDSIPRVNADIFSRYTYQETHTQYLMPPFEYFAIDFNILFRVNPNCIDYVTEKEPECMS